MYRTQPHPSLARGHLNVVTFLVQHGANLDVQNKFGKTALHLASCRYPDKRWDDFHTFLYDHREHAPDHCPALMVASESGEVNLATFLIERGANVTVKDDFGATALHYAAYHQQESLQLLSCLTKNGGDVNACTNDNCTPLMIAALCGQVDTMTFLIEHGAHVDLQDKDGDTALHYAVLNSASCCEVLSCLIKNGADVNACGNDGHTLLMKAIINYDETVATFLIEHGANIDHQDKYGDTALHFVVCTCEHKTLDNLLALGASHLFNSVGLTPLLQASTCDHREMVEYLIQRPEITKEQRIDALELLGASLIVNSEEFNEPNLFDLEEPMQDAFKYMKQGMELRFANPFQPLLKQPMEPVEAYGNRKECQTLEELAQIEDDFNAIIMECLIIRERILGKQNTELLKQIRPVAFYMYRYGYMYDPLRSMELYRRAVEIAQSSDQEACDDLCKIYRLLGGNFQMKNHLKQRDVLKLLEQTVVEYEKQDRIRKGIDDYSVSEEPDWKLFDLLVQLLSFIPRFFEEDKISVLALLRKLNRYNPRCYELGDTLLHRVIRWYMNDSGIETVKLLLNAGFNVNAVNRDRDTPLHLAVTFKASNDKIHVLTDMLELLLDGGAHHDFVNDRSETPMDMARTNEARLILSKGRKLELKCISARAIKKSGIPYLGVVPQTVEKYIKMH